MSASKLDLVYFAIAAIDNFSCGEILATSKNLLDFLTGAHSPYSKFFSSFSGIYGKWPSANRLNILLITNDLIKQNRILRSDINGNFVFMCKTIANKSGLNNKSLSVFAQISDDPFNFADYVRRGSSLYINGRDDPLDVLIFLSEFPHYEFSSETQIVSEEAIKIRERSYEFVFSSKFWRIVCWTSRSVSVSRPDSILLTTFGNHLVWVILSAENHKVICHAEHPFFYKDSQSCYSTDDLLGLAFSNSAM